VNNPGGTLLLTDITGKIIQTRIASGSEEELDMSECARGIYILRYINGVHTTYTRLVK